MDKFSINFAFGYVNFNSSQDNIKFIPPKHLVQTIIDLLQGVFQSSLVYVLVLNIL